MVVAGDLGGTHLRLALVARDGTIYSLRKEGIATSLRREPLRFLSFVTSLVEELIALARSDGGDVTSVGFGVAGKIDRVRGTILFSPNLPHLNGVPFGEELSKRLSLPVMIENDANVFGLGESWRGKARGWEHWLGITLGTGVGGCLMLCGTLWHGEEGIGFVGEIGHTTVFPEGLPCACGKRGCLEAYASEGGLRRQVAHDSANNWQGCTPTPLFQDQYHPMMTAKALFDLATQGDPYAVALFQRFGYALGVAVANAFTLLGIRRAVIGGGVSEAWPCFAPSLEVSLRENCSMLASHEMVVVKSDLGDSAALLGAATVAFKAASFTCGEGDEGI